MKTETSHAVRWGKAARYGIAIGTVLGTVVGVATKNAVFVYLGMSLGGGIGNIFTSTTTGR